MSASEFPVIVVGAGAAGLLAATFAAEAGAGVAVLETSARPGAKIRVSGGGRCNVLPSAADERDYRPAASRRAVRRLLRSWPLEEVREHFERRLGVRLKTEPGGKVFPVSDSSREVVEALLADLARSGARLVAPARVTGLRPTAGGWELATAAGPRFRARRLVLATGGKSLPKTGSDGAVWPLVEALGHRVRAAHPALVPLRAADRDWAELAGISVRALLEVRVGGRVAERREGDLLFTHDGFSGPGVMDVSAWFTDPDTAALATLFACWGGEAAPDWDEVLRSGGRAIVGGPVRAALPRRLADRLLARARVDPALRLAELPRESRRRLVAGLGSCELRIAGDGGWNKAEVTAGGIPLAEVRPDSLESRLAPGLHFAGEILDVTGPIGGYNFLWAWVTGRRAGEAAARGLRAEPTSPSGGAG